MLEPLHGLYDHLLLHIPGHFEDRALAIEGPQWVEAGRCRFGWKVDARDSGVAPNSPKSQSSGMWRFNFKDAAGRARFLWHLTRARSAEIAGDLDEARQRLEQAIPTKRYLALRGAYDARLASISYVGKVVAEGEEKHPPNEMLRLIAELQTQQWYWAPRNKNERFAARYLDYLEAAVLGEGERRGLIAEELKQTDADSYFKQVLLVTC